MNWASIPGLRRYDSRLPKTLRRDPRMLLHSQLVLNTPKSYSVFMSICVFKCGILPLLSDEQLRIARSWKPCAPVVLPTAHRHRHPSTAIAAAPAPLRPRCRARRSAGSHVRSDRGSSAWSGPAPACRWAKHRTTRRETAGNRCRGGVGTATQLGLALVSGLDRRRHDLDESRHLLPPGFFVR